MVQESNALVVRQSHGMELQTMDDLERFSNLMATSGMFSDIKSAAQAAVKIAYGQELGIPPITALTKIHFFTGKPTMSAEVMGNLIKRSGTWDYEPVTITNERCEIQFYKHGKPFGAVVVFTLEDAERAGVTGKDNWKKYPKNMLFARALSNGARWHCPHVIGGAYIPEELDAPINEDGELILEQPKTARPVVSDVTPKNGKPYQPAPIHTDADGLPFAPEPEQSLERKQTLESINIGVKILAWSPLFFGKEINKKFPGKTKPEDLTTEELVHLSNAVSTAVDLKSAKANAPAETSMGGKELPEQMQ